MSEMNDGCFVSGPTGIRRILRTFYEEAELCETDGEREQLITRVVKEIQACKFCAFEKEQLERGDE